MRRDSGRRLIAIGALVAVAGCATTGGSAAGGFEAKKGTLYARLGGYDAIAAVTDNFLGRILADTAIAPFFKGLEDRDKQRIRQLIVDQLCEAAGGPCLYVGRTMKVTHAEMQISERVWNTFAGHFVATLTAAKVPPREQQELLEFVGSLKADIVH